MIPPTLRTIVFLMLACAACRAENEQTLNTRSDVAAATADSAVSGNLALGDTDAPAPTIGAEADDTVNLVDPAIPAAVAGEDGWGYSLTAEADLTGDGIAERIVLTARVEMIDGQPAWDDGQPWQVYVETADESRTYLYSRRLQLGTLDMRVTSGSDGGSPSVVFIEHLPDQLAVYESMYVEPGKAITMSRFVRRLDPRGEIASPHLP